MVGLARVELATNGLGNRCSIHLSYSPSSIDYYSFTAIHGRLDVWFLSKFSLNLWIKTRKAIFYRHTSRAGIGIS